MKFKPLSEKEIKEMGLVPEGIYSFEILDAESKKSKNDNEMIELKLAIFDAGGTAHYIFDYITGNERMMFKLRHLAHACGLEDQYETGTLEDEDLKGKTGQCKIGIQKGSAQYPADKNVVKDYIVPIGESESLKNDSIPF